MLLRLPLQKEGIVLKLATKAEINQLDFDAINQYGIPSLLLMEHAAYQVFDYLTEEHAGKEVAILCGPGNNGGDGLALARQLFSFKGAKLKVLLLVSEDKLSKDGRVYYDICEKLQIPCLRYPKDKVEIEETIEKAEVIVDAVFGTGLSRAVTGYFYEIIKKINESKAFKLSVDVPSGIHPETGAVLGIAVKADCTITFQLGKVGLFLYPALCHIGKLRIVDIGIPKVLLENMPSKHYAIDLEMARKMLPKRSVRSNKGTYGKVLMIGGQIGMSGAICLGGHAALRTGAGLVTIGVPSSLVELVDQKVTEAMTLSLPEIQGHLDETAAKILKERLVDYEIIAIGPGLGRSSMIQKVMEVVLESEKLTVVDADGLYALKPYLEKLKSRKIPMILTPHPGEMSYLTGESISDILSHPLESAKAFSKKYNVIVVLKLERMIIAVPGEDTLYINTKGHQAIAKGGAGDVLTGFITGLLAQNKEPIAAALLGCYLHGDTAQRLAALKGDYSVLPSDLIEHVGESFKGLAQERL